MQPIAVDSPQQIGLEKLLKCSEHAACRRRYRPEVIEQLRPWLCGQRRRRRAKSEQLGSNLRLSLTEPPPQPITARGTCVAASLSPGCLAASTANHRHDKGHERRGPHREAPQRLRQQHRKRPSASTAPMAVRAENTPASDNQLTALTGVAAKHSVPDQRLAAAAVRARHQLRLVQKIVQVPFCADEPGRDFHRRGRAV